MIKKKTSEMTKKMKNSSLVYLPLDFTYSDYSFEMFVTCFKINNINYQNIDINLQNCNMCLETVSENITYFYNIFLINIADLFLCY